MFILGKVDKKKKSIKAAISKLATPTKNTQMYF